MKILDSHSDILTDVTIRRLGGETDIFRKYHVDRLRKGNVKGLILVVWVDPPHTDNPARRVLDVLGATFEEIEDMKEFAGIVYKACDMDEIQSSGRIPIVLGMEGLSGLGGNASLMIMLHKLGIRHASLTWNEENEFATGISSKNTDRGITEQGIKVVKMMEALGMIVDVSHANEKTFWDICEHTEKPFIASHSNVYKLCSVPRNLKDDQIKAIAQRGGVIGINAWPDFVDKESPSLEKLVLHIDYIADMVGIDHIGFGFDFCDFLNGNTTVSFQEGETTASSDIEDASKIPKLIKLLKKKGYNTQDIEKIAYKNMENIIKKLI
ncbi:MAG: peptidase M19 [Clostridia bacterium BRH_c25]|nr:MAG: peptidase M19 [Clostridia bacterium BRH_c25]